MSNECPDCGATFEGTDGPAALSNHRVAKHGWRVTDDVIDFYPPDKVMLPSHEVGPWSEYVVAADLMKRGLRPALMPAGAPFDLLVFNGGEPIRVEVTTIELRRNSKKLRTLRDEGFEVLAVVNQATEEVTYHVALDSRFAQGEAPR